MYLLLHGCFFTKYPHKSSRLCFHPQPGEEELKSTQKSQIKYLDYLVHERWEEGNRKGGEGQEKERKGKVAGKT